MINYAHMSSGDESGSETNPKARRKGDKKISLIRDAC